MKKIILNTIDGMLYVPLVVNSYDTPEFNAFRNAGWNWEWKRGAWIAPLTFDNLKFAQSVLRLPEQDYQMLLSELIDHNESVLAQSRASRTSERSFDQWMESERL